MKLSKKQRKHYTKKITEKLNAIGILDKITYRYSGHNKLIPQPQTITVNQPQPKAGQMLHQDCRNDTPPGMVEIKTYIAQNIHRNILKRLLVLPEPAIKRFLSTDIGELAQKLKEVAPNEK